MNKTPVWCWVCKAVRHLDTIRSFPLQTGDYRRVYDECLASIVFAAHRYIRTAKNEDL